MSEILKRNPEKLRNVDKRMYCAACVGIGETEGSSASGGDCTQLMSHVSCLMSLAGHLRRPAPLLRDAPLLLDGLATRHAADVRGAHVHPNHGESLQGRTTATKTTTKSNPYIPT